MLSRFNIIVAIDGKNGIGKNGSIPWRNKEDFEHFRKTTIGNGNNAVIMGRKTYESLPSNFRPLPNRRNFVLSSQPISGVDTYTSLGSILKECSQFNQVFIIGGQRLYEEAIKYYLYLCDDIYISHIQGDFNCDVFFPYDLVTKFKREMTPRNTFSLETITVNVVHPEQQYLDLLKSIQTQGEKRLDRTKVGTLSVFGQRLVFDLRDGFPLLTTKSTWFNGIKKELLFFLSGKTDTKLLEEQGVNIWKGNTTTEFLTKNKLPWREGDMGPGYGFQWRHCGAEYKGCDHDYSGQGVDQIKNLINGIKNDPFGRRHIISAWDVANINIMALPPCHCFVQFYVGCDQDSNPKYLDCCMYQRSADMFLGVPFNIASYSLLLCIIAHLTGLTARKFIHDLGDTHIYLNHQDQVSEQSQRVPFPFPTLKFKRDIIDIDDVKLSDIVLENYQCHSKLTAEMAV